MTRNRYSHSAFHLLSFFVAILALTVPAWAEWKEKVLYSFQGIPDGAYPAGGVVFDKAGNLYGATTYGGANNCPGITQCGIVFQLQVPAQKGGAWSEHVLYVFKGVNSNDGDAPVGGVLIDRLGNLYGTTAYGGTGKCMLFGGRVGCGTVYELVPPKQKGGVWTEKVLYSFQSGKDGYFPWGDLTFDSAGNLYGATQYGGGKGTTCDQFYQFCGTVFKMSPPTTKGGKWTEKVLHSFAGGSDGANPNGGLVLDSKGAIYGTTPYGGNQGCKSDSGIGCGTVFSLKPPAQKDGAWTKQSLHVFTDGSSDGAGPNGGLIFDSKGSLYGTGGGGGSGNGFGVVFRLAHREGKWVETVLHSFQGGADGRDPSGPVTLDAAGNLYGPTNADGSYFGGTIFQMKPAKGSSGKWEFSSAYSFKGPPDGQFPAARLIFNYDGRLYSTTSNGGTGNACQNGCGTVFQLSP